MSLNHKKIVLGITGSIAAYKSADLARRLREAGAEVRVVMTEAAKQFITPMTMQAVSGHPVHHDLFDTQAEAAMGHIDLAKWADVILVAPASANFMAKLAHGEAGDLLNTVCLATVAPIIIAPAMNQAMWQHSLTQANVQLLLRHNIQLLQPAVGLQACGDHGPGRMLEPSEICDYLTHFQVKPELSGQRILITAGPTREALDPMRFLSNCSSGKMGFALAEAAVKLGARVTLISGPVHLDTPPHVSRINIQSAEEMYEAVMAEAGSTDIFISVAAVADYKAQQISLQKLPKMQKIWSLNLERNPDIVASVAALKHKPFTVGFAAETENLIDNAKTKLNNKCLDMIVANTIYKNNVASDDNAATVLWHKGSEQFPAMPKKLLAYKILHLIAKIKIGE